MDRPDERTISLNRQFFFFVARHKHRGCFRSPPTLIFLLRKLSPGAAGGCGEGREPTLALEQRW